MSVSIRWQGLGLWRRRMATAPHRFRDSLEDQFKELVGRIEKTAKRKAPVDTGRLRKAITSDIKGFNRNNLTAEIGPDEDTPHKAFYGKFQEKGRRPGERRGRRYPGMRKRPFLRPAVKRHNADVRRLLGKAFKVV